MSDINPKHYWNLVKKLKELDANSVNGTNPISPEDWLKHFSKLLFDDKQNRSSLLEERINEMFSCNSFSDLDFRITNDEIKKAISSLKCGKATGLDKISSEMIKASVNVNLFMRNCLMQYQEVVFIQHAGMTVIFVQFINLAHEATHLTKD